MDNGQTIAKSILKKWEEHKEKNPSEIVCGETFHLNTRMSKGSWLEGKIHLSSYIIVKIHQGSIAETKAIINELQQSKERYMLFHSGGLLSMHESHRWYQEKLTQHAIGLGADPSFHFFLFHKRMNHVVRDHIAVEFEDSAILFKHNQFKLEHGDSSKRQEVIRLTEATDNSYFESFKKAVDLGSYFLSALGRKLEQRNIPYRLLSGGLSSDYVEGGNRSDNRRIKLYLNVRNNRYELIVSLQGHQGNKNASEKTYPLSIEPATFSRGIHETIKHFLEVKKLKRYSERIHGQFMENDQFIKIFGHYP